MIPPMPGIEKIVSITRLPPMMLVNMGTMMFINGSRELRIPWFKVACRSVSPLVLARSMKSELMVSASSALKYLVTRAMGPKDRAMMGSARPWNLAQPVDVASKMIGNSPPLNATKYWSSVAKINDGTEIKMTTRNEIR